MESLLADGLCEEVDARIERAREAMRAEGFDALLVYGNNKINGSLRYLSGYWPDRGGWLAVGPHRRNVGVFDGATLLLPSDGDPVLVFDVGQLLDREACTQKTTMSGLGMPGLDSPSIGGTIADILRDAKSTDVVGIETWDKFPAPLYIELTDLLPRTQFRPSIVVEDLTIVKSPWEIDLFRKAAAIGDRGHQAFLEALRTGVGKTEVELIRVAEAVMREADPVYEEVSPISPSLICSGRVSRLYLLHAPMEAKRVAVGDAVNWDICMRYQGYPIDTSRTRVVGRATEEQTRAYDAAMAMSTQVLDTAAPGVQVQDLVELADSIARESGFELWDRFLGHGLGLDAHGRPDMGYEEMELAENMVITVEPRIALNDEYLFGNEDMVLVTADGAEPLTTFPKTPLELEI